ncbi:NupC/NupG family nucleoside CNT transporter [Simiduia sp. 21SJ11W-1]|uniref:NupC/NupG family nucleoside CNT transporter n=1 Tax=Simiduia sp. 21SJ11W-1 TaxID=2909669 RepID=UPI00209D9391|nr:NupC/NupG family nucleoside CNT transporter [Simiduia sp. 21SJ11W-1]UTA48266.1 NupC/NupG family nucleoside CNT transporter [Simiduia sp. 21SJ11W-1]
MGILGVVALLAIAYLLSDNRRAINLRTVIGAFLLQASFAALVLYVPWGKEALASAAASIQHVIDYSNDGIRFLFGGLASDSIGFVFAIQVLPVIVFLSALMSVLYYIGVMQRVVEYLGGAVQRLLGTSRTESLSAAANIFMGQTEAPLVVKPFINRMTNSELFAVMAGGLASIAGAVMAGYAAMGVELKYLIAASFMAAPGGLLMAKIIKPETEAPRVDDVVSASFDEQDKPANVIDAAAGGALTGMKLAMNIGAMLVAFIALIALLNGMLGGVAGWFGVDGLTLQQILGWLLAPLAFLMGVPWSDAVAMGSLVGQKLVLNEFVAYIELIGVRESLSAQTQVIATFALCGFANLSSIAILLGGLGGMAPERRHDIARMGLKAVAAGTLSNLMSATLAGLFISLA